MKTLRIGMIGYKFMGKAHSNAYRQVPVFFDPPIAPEMTVICGRDEAGVSAAAKRYGWQSWETSWQKVIDRDDVDLVDINTPTDKHAEIAIAAAKRGKHVLLEKPLAMDLAEAKTVVEAVRRAGVKHMIGFNYRHFPAIQLAKRLIDGGALGRIFHLRAVYLQDWLVDPKFPLVWRVQREIAGSGSLGDLGAHILDFATFLVGDIDAVSATAETFVKERPLPLASEGLSAQAGTEMGPVTVDDAVIILARFANGALGTFEATRFAPGHRNGGAFEINGSGGSLRFNLERLNELEFMDAKDGAEAGFRTILATDSSHPYMSGWWPTGHMLGWEHSHVNQVYHLIDSIANDRMPVPSLVDGLKNQAVLEAVGDSIADGRWHSVERVSE